jgi:uncharacterized protein with GYD domain
MLLVKKIKESPARVEAAKQTIRNLGGEVKAFYGIPGSEFDTMFIFEAPNEQKAGEMVLAIAVRGYVRTRTHRLFSEDEFKAIIASLP